MKTKSRTRRLGSHFLVLFTALTSIGCGASLSNHDANDSSFLSLRDVQANPGWVQVTTAITIREIDHTMPRGSVRLLAADTSDISWRVELRQAGDDGLEVRFGVLEGRDYRYAIVPVNQHASGTPYMMIGKYSLKNGVRLWLQS